MDFSRAMELVERGFSNWAAKEYNRRWVTRIDGTPIQNDLCVNIAQAIAEVDCGER
jgi:hypothetical protein